MVVPLRPARFYGRSFPRPRFYTDVKFSDERVDPPTPVLDPLMSWANEAHWSMGGLCLNRLRLQGKIEGNVEKLRKQREKSFKMKMENSPLKGVDSPPPAPISKKRRQRVKVVDDEGEEEDNDDDDDDEEDEEEEIEMEIRKVKRNGGMKKRRLVRKLGDDFELVAEANRRTPLKDVSNGVVVSEGGVALRTRSRRSMVLNEEEDEGRYDEKNSKSEKIKEKDVVSVTPKKMSKKNGDKKGLSVTPNGSRSSPRLKQKSN
ncbi:myb-like protein V [Chenopodium quinoa]|uniref:myb-like protein V n=1 Tax=Chenopodium quinoa TaxID=63459 RepID=UPI000B799E5D|nr:myb-like protein V [Chenopodium quinoa]